MSWSVTPAGNFIYTKLLHKIIDKHKSIQTNMEFLTQPPPLILEFFALANRYVCTLYAYICFPHL
jgi:hypothetical protein